MAVNGRQAKLKESHDMTRVVDVSCVACIYQFCTVNFVDRIRPKDGNGGTDDISGVARIWCEGHQSEETKRRLRSAESAETETNSGLV